MRSRHFVLPVALLSVGAALLGSQPATAPSLLILNARIFTGAPAAPLAEAVTIVGERIGAVGTTATLRATAGPTTRVIDAAGRVVIPGINDAHVHIGATPAGIKLEGPPAFEHDPTLDEVLERLRVAAPKAPKGSWIFGEVGEHVLDDPNATRFALDTITPAHLVALQAWTGHGALFNTAALRRLNVREDEPDPAGGFFVRVPGTKTITGVAHEYANWIVRQRLTMIPDEKAQIAALRAFGQEASALGITSVQWMLTARPVAAVARTSIAASLPQRIRLIDFPMTTMSTWREPARRKVKGAPRVAISGTKWVLDGTPIERLMFLREPYSDRRETPGRLNFPTEDVTDFLRRAFAVREQPMFHAVGDAAIDTVLNGLERTGGDSWQPLRPRIEHGDMLEEDRLCTLVMIGVRPDGTKELLAVEDGYRESTDSWATVLRDLKRRGLRAPLVAVGDSALGFWAAVGTVWAETREQRCWVHRIANVLDKLPKRLQPKAKQALHATMQAPTRAEAEAGIDVCLPESQSTTRSAHSVA